VTDPASTYANSFAAVVTGVRLPFCVMNAAGAATTANELRALARSGTGAVVLPTTTVRPFLHPQFRSLHNPGFDKLLPLVRELAAAGGRPVVASIAGPTPDEIATLAKAFADAGAHAIEANLADPWVEATLAPFEDEAVLAETAARLAAAAGACPSWVTLPPRPHLPYARLVEILLDAGVRGVVAHNEFTGFEKLQVEAPRPIDVVVTGGIECGYDVLRAIGKGVRAVQVDVALRREGAGVFARLEREMRRAEVGAS
jgi:dihydroorotate dehydrogenase